MELKVEVDVEVDVDVLVLVDVVTVVVAASKKPPHKHMSSRMHTHADSQANKHPQRTWAKRCPLWVCVDVTVDGTNSNGPGTVTCRALKQAVDTRHYITNAKHKCKVLLEGICLHPLTVLSAGLCSNDEGERDGGEARAKGGQRRKGGGE